MYLHLGQDTVVKMSEVVGIFDLETSTISKMFQWKCQKLLYCAKIIKKIPSFIFLKYLLPLC